MLALSLAAACVDGSEEPSADPTAWPYPESLFPRYEGDPQTWCRVLSDVIPDNGYMPGTESDLQGWNTSCSMQQLTDQGSWSIDSNIYGQWDDEAPSPQENFENLIATVPAIPIEGFGSEAALVRMGTVVNTKFDEVQPWDYGLSLVVVEENLLLEFNASSLARAEEGDDVAIPDFRMSPLPLTADTTIQLASGFMAELGAENHALEAPQATLDEGITALPDLCSELDLGMDPAADQSDWAIDGDSMDGCHWADGEANLWLSAEAVGPLPAAGLSAEDFATWWAGALPSAEGKALDLGDQASIVELDPETADVEVPAADFVVRIGNIVLQGRFQDGTAEPGAAAEEFVSVITEQAQSLLPAG